MKNIILGLSLLIGLASCKTVDQPPNAQTIIDKSMAVSGATSFDKTKISFRFRGRTYISERNGGKYQLERITLDSIGTIRDVVNNSGFSRYIDDALKQVPDSMASRYGNSINSVHYFAYLPYGLNDAAVRKELLGESTIKGNSYYKIKVSFVEEGGGDDFEDTYVYWIDKENFTIDYLAYDFHVNGGGMRFREAYNVRIVNGIRFVDYRNFKPKNKDNTTVYELDRLFDEDQLELLSDIAIEEIIVSPIS